MSRNPYDSMVSIQSLGGKASAAKLTPEERAARAKRAGLAARKKLGKEGLRARSLKGQETRRKAAEREALIERGREAKSREPASG